ncbi:MAG: ribonuclease III [Clostridia bacterium]|nr:ribonuclease III [Clostridia bacterium]
MDDRVRQVEAIIEYEFKNKGLLKLALTHSSAALNQANIGLDNERLEFLGDAVLELSISEYLYKTYPDMNEGQMTRSRAGLVREAALYRAARRMGLGEHIHMSHGEEMSGGRDKPAILSDTLEAVIAAIFLDGGFDAAKRFVLNFTHQSIENKEVSLYVTDYKTTLQEYVQRRHKGSTLEYRLAGEEGPDHKKVFLMQLLFNGEVIGEGAGTSKQSAGQEAARLALKRLKKDNPE